METRAANLQPAEAEGLPKWKLKANWILRQYARIWCLEENPDTINFDIAFRDVFTQFLLDQGFSEKDAESWINHAYKDYALHNKREPHFSTMVEKWRWITENSLPLALFQRFISEEVIEKIFRIARLTEKALNEGIDPVDFILQPWLHYEYYLKLHALPPDGHEWVGDPPA